MTNWDKIEDEYNKSNSLKPREEVPDGNYQVYLDGLDIREKEGKNALLCWDLVIINPQSPHAGRHIYKVSSITATTMPYVKTDLEICKFPGNVVELRDPTIREKFLDLCFEIKKEKRKGSQYANVYFNNLIEVNDLDELKAMIKEGVDQNKQNEPESEENTGTTPF